MYDVVGYHRPTSLPDALRLLAADGRVALAGGVHLRHDRSGHRVDLVDLQAAGLAGIEVSADRATLGATTRLQDLVDDERLPELVRSAARAEQPSTLRTLATVGGAVATAPDDSLLLAALVVHDATVRLASHDGGENVVGLGDHLTSGGTGGELIVAVTIELGGTAAMSTTGRTPRDRPIVGVVGRRVDGAGVVLAACGVGPVPVRFDAGDVASLPSFDDHRATATYRRHLADVLTGRVLEELA